MKKYSFRFSRVFLLTAAMTAGAQYALYCAGAMNVSADCPSGQVSGAWTNPIPSPGYPKVVTYNNQLMDLSESYIKFVADPNGNQCGVGGTYVFTDTYTPHQGGTTATYVPPPPPVLP